MALRWGIAAAGKISNDFVSALTTLDNNQHTIVAVAARDLNRATEFANRFEILNAYGSYKELAEDKTVQVVYIGTLNPQHFEVAQLMLEYGKHVLVEKPLTLNEKQSRELVHLAEHKGLFLLEAIWSRFLPSYQYIRELLKNGTLGDIVSVDTEFGFEIESVERLWKKELGGGTVLDLGVYAIQIAQLIFDKEPQSIEATGKLNEDGVDLEMSAKICYGDNKIARIKTSALRTLSNQAKIVGTKGEIVIPNFWCATSLIDVDGNEKTWPLPTSKHPFNFINSAGLRYEAEEVRKCILNGKTGSYLLSHAESLLIARVQDKIRKQIGVHYVEDD